jgi:copper chaperone CopZ
MRKKTSPSSIVLSITGMTCAGCVGAVTRVLSRVPGVSEAKVDLAAGRATVAGIAAPEALVAAVAAAGYGAAIP